jgi:transcriptional regulator with XRE-family HTH domain
MKLPIYEFVLKELAEAKGSWPEVASGSGISKRTIEKIARREVKNPGIHHVQRLADYFARKAA